MADDRGKYFDILDKALASRGYELYARPWIARQDYDEWMADYGRLQTFAESNSDNSYVRNQWRDEKPRYVNAPAQLLAKVRIANPANYDTTIHASSDCGCSNIPQLPYSPLSITPGSYGDGAGRSGSNYFFGNPGSLGDNLRTLFSPSSLPFFPNPTDNGNKLIDRSEVASGVLVALIVGAILWAVHYFTKKKNA